MSANRFSSIKTLLSTRKLKLVAIKGDGNCFYRAIATAYYKDPDMHYPLRRTLMDHMLAEADEYSLYFEDSKRFTRVLQANKRKGVWNSDLCDLVPLAVSKLLNIRVEVYSVITNEEDENETSEVIRYVFGERNPNTLRLLHQDNHYDLLVKD